MSKPIPPITGLWAYQRGRIYARDLDAGRPPNVPAPRLDAEFREATPADAAALARAMNHDDVHEILNRLQMHERRCFAGWFDEKIVTYCWISMKHEYVGEMERELNILDDESYVWNCATLPDYRRQGLYTALLHFILTRLAAGGMQRVWIGANLENVPSYRAFQSAGFLPAAEFTYLRFWRFYTFVTRPLPATPPRLLPAARHLFRLDTQPTIGSLTVGLITDRPISNL